MSKEPIKIDIDGQQVSAQPGQMLIEVMDRNQITVPRFCYHPRLSIAANCRMCMVEVGKIPKPVPACATPVVPNMVVRSRSELALEGQKGTMEFLLINHPLDCPICDQGGECELQDVSMAHGQSYSRFSEGKRAVEDEDIGPLISTDMTRCIHCTRCVRFGTEVAGLQELGATGRGEDMRIGTFVKHSVSSELSGNMIDVCPVGALNSRPYRMRARAWEMDRDINVANHDCLGSHTFVHLLRGKVMRVLPKECEDINLSWISDRDRFSYTALEHPQRLHHPQILDSVKSRCEQVDWYSAITASAKAILNAIQFKETDKVGVLVGANSTLEEMHLLGRLFRQLGIENIDHRLSQTDFSHQQDMPTAPLLGCTLAELAESDAMLLIGADVRKMQPVLGARLRQAALNGAHISTINLFREDLNFPADTQMMGDPDKIFSDLLSVFRHLTHSSKTQSEAQRTVSKWTSKIIVKPQEIHKRLANRLLKSKSTTIILGAGAFALPNFSAIRALAQALAELTGAHFGFLTGNANTVGAWYSGCVPHRSGIDSKTSRQGMDVGQMLEKPLDMYVLFNCEPEFDCQQAAQAMAALEKAKTVISINSFTSDSLDKYADIHLPLASSFESPGTFVNATGQWQYHEASAPPIGQSLPGWKILSMLARACNVDELDYRSCDDLSDEVVERYQSVPTELRSGFQASSVVSPPVTLRRLVRPSTYCGDASQRRAAPLQETIDSARDRFVWIHPSDAKKRAIAHGDYVSLTQNKKTMQLQAMHSDAVSPDTVLTALGTGCEAILGTGFEAVEIKKDKKTDKKTDKKAGKKAGRAESSRGKANST